MAQLYHTLGRELTSCSRSNGSQHGVIKFRLSNTLALHKLGPVVAGTQRTRVRTKAAQLAEQMTVQVENGQGLGERSKIELALSELQAKKREWAELSLDKKIELLDAVRRRLLHNLTAWGLSGAEAKAGNHEELVVMEMLVSVVPAATYIHRLLETLRSLRTTNKAPKLSTRTTATGQLAVQVFPHTWSDRNSLLLPGVVKELVLQPGETTVRQAEQYGKDGRVTTHQGRVCAILGAGNQGFLTLKDALVCLFERGEVVVVKPHPIQKEWQRGADYVLQPLIEAGYLRTLYLDSIEETQQLVYSPLVDCVHMTGGTATHDAIVWGSSEEEQRRRREANDPLLKVPITSELGCVSPVIVAPWDFTPSQLRSQAASVALSMTNNNGCNCNSAKVLLLPAEWPQAAAFLENLRTILRECQLEPPYYPGIEKRYATFKEHYPHCEVIEAAARTPCRPLSCPPLPYLINVMEQLPEKPSQEFAFSTEPFAPVLTVVKLPGRGPEEFLRAATAYANDCLWGTLSCTLVLHPELEKAYPEATQQAIADLRYGVVAINTWASVSFLSGACTWGAFAGDQTIADVGSGLGLVGNPYLVEGIQKAVCRVPLEGPAVSKPAHMEPVPMVFAKMVAGYGVDGLRGIVTALLSK